MKILLTISYKGTGYVGWQNQKNGKSVQKTIEKAISKLLRQDVELAGSGRTDAGVHAFGQAATFDATSNSFYANFTSKGSKKVCLNSARFVRAINAYLPSDIYVTSAKEVSENFHARYSAKEKVYEYHLQVGKSPILDGLVGEFNQMPNLELIKEAAQILVGTHDFSSFCSAKAEVSDYVRTINYIKVYMTKADQIIFEISGNGFLYNMVRAITGTVLYAAEGKFAPEDIPGILERGDRTAAGPTVPPGGLYLTRLWYEDERLNG